MKNQIRKQLYADHESGMSCSELAEKYDCNRSTAREIVRNINHEKAIKNKRKRGKRVWVSSTYLDMLQKENEEWRKYSEKVIESLDGKSHKVKHIIMNDSCLKKNNAADNSESNTIEDGSVGQYDE